MTNLIVKGKEFDIAFDHKTKTGKRARLHRGPIRAVTTCVVMSGKFIAIDTALCSTEDQFSRAEGRLRALKNLLDHCWGLRDVAKEFWTRFNDVEICPSCGDGPDSDVCQACFSPVYLLGTGHKDGALDGLQRIACRVELSRQAGRRATKLEPAEVARRKEAGRSIREARARRSSAGARA